MRTKPLIGLVSTLLLTIFSAACGPSSEEILATAAQMAETMAAVQLTAIAEANPTATATATLPSPTPTKKTSATPFVSTGSQCLAASLSDETIPDDTLMAPGQSFEKAWVLTNMGTCTWTENFALVFHHGDSMSAVQNTPLAGWVEPGKSVTLTLGMTAPSEGGSHIGFWSLLSPDGVYFGPSANGVFWVRINVSGEVPTSTVKTIIGSSGSAGSDGSTNSATVSGDDTGNDSWRGISAFSYAQLRDDVVVTGVTLDLSQIYTVEGDPFSDLGCLNIYISYSSDYYSASGNPLWIFCSVADLSGSARYGGPNAISVIQNTLSGSQIQLILQFDQEGDLDGDEDSLTVTNPALTIFYYR